MFTAGVQNPVSLLQGLPSLAYTVNYQTIGGLSERQRGELVELFNS